MEHWEFWQVLLFTNNIALWLLIFGAAIKAWTKDLP